jgi:heat shock protein HtpX
LYLSSRHKLIFILAVFAVLMLWTGFLLAGWIGLVAATMIAVLIHWGGQRWTSTLLLRLHHAQAIEESHDPELFFIVRHLAHRANMPSPRVYVTPEPSPNVFAIGRDPSCAAIILTSGLRQALSREEQAAVMAHELAHIKSGDTPLMSMVAILAEVPYLLGHSIRKCWRGALAEATVKQMAMPIVALLIRCLLTDVQELNADELGAWMTGEPLVLASALLRIEAELVHTPMQHVTPATAHLFIVNPYALSGLTWLSSTHPSTQLRVSLLEDMEP